MQLLPHKVGPVTLMRRMGTDGNTESFVGILDDPAGKTVVARRIEPDALRDASRVAALEARLGDLVGIRHAALIPVLREISADGERLVIEDWTEGLTLERIIKWCASKKINVPHNVFLNLATQICNGLEALHARPGPSSGAEAVLHLALHPGSVRVGIEGRVQLGGYGLFRSPVANAQSEFGKGSLKLEYMAPEQTHPDQALGPPADLFALGALLYEMLMGKPMFRAESNLQTIQRVRRAEVTTQLLEVREVFPGLDRVLYRALNLNPRHRYQRAFVLREDLRALMAGFSFATIVEDTRSFLSPIFQRTQAGDDPTSETPIGFTGADAALMREKTLPPQNDTGILLRGGLLGGSGDFRPPTSPLDASGPSSIPPSPSMFTQATPATARERRLSALASHPAPPPRAPETSPPSAVPKVVDEIQFFPAPSPTPQPAATPAAGAGSRTPEPAATPASALPKRSPAAEPRGAAAPEPAPPAQRIARTPTPRVQASPPPPEPIRAALPPPSRRPWTPLAVGGGALGLALVAYLAYTGMGALGPFSGPNAEPPDEDLAAAEPAPGPGAQPREAIPVPLTPAILSDMTVRATRGQLDATDRATLEALDASDPNYSRGFTLLYEDAKARGDKSSTQSYLDRLLAVPANSSRPELLIEAAQLSFDRSDWDGAIRWAQKAEQHWARLPSDLVFSSKASIFELQARSWTSKSVAGGGADSASLDAAIRGWEKYRTHVSTQPSRGLVGRAEEQLAKLRGEQKQVP